MNIVSLKHSTPNALQLLGLIQKHSEIHGDGNLTLAFYSKPYMAAKALRYDEETETLVPDGKKTMTRTERVVTVVPKELTLRVSLNARLVEKMIDGARARGNIACQTLDRFALDLLHDPGFHHKKARTPCPEKEEEYMN